MMEIKLEFYFYFSCDIKCCVHTKRRHILSSRKLLFGRSKTEAKVALVYIKRFTLHSGGRFFFKKYKFWPATFLEF